MWIGRIFQGAAAASGAVIARAMIRDIYEGDRAAQIMALTSASMASVPLFAPTLGALITVELGWRFTFIAQAIFAAALLLGLASFQETVKRAEDAPQAQLRLRDDFIVPRMSFKPFICWISAQRHVLVLWRIRLYLDRSLLPQRRVQRINGVFGVVFAMTAAGFIVGSLLSSRLVLKWGADRTLRRGAFICALATTSALLTLINPEATKALLALISVLFFFGVGLIAPNASMGAVSLLSSQSRRCIGGLRKCSFRGVGNGWRNCRGNVRWQNAGTDNDYVCLFSGCINWHHNHTSHRTRLV